MNNLAVVAVHLDGYRSNACSSLPQRHTAWATLAARQQCCNCLDMKKLANVKSPRIPIQVAKNPTIPVAKKRKSGSPVTKPTEFFQK